MTERDAVLTGLLILELERHLVTLAAEAPDLDAARSAIHALKGSAGLAGEPQLAASLQRIERRAREGDLSALLEAGGLVRRAVESLRRGEPALGTVWPEPPPDLEPFPIDPLVRAQYRAEITDRLAGLDAALHGSANAVEAAELVYRHVHTMKGAASAVGDEPMSWFCHGLEERLKHATTNESAVSALAELLRWRAVLGVLLADPAGALRLLRGTPRRPSTMVTANATAEAVAHALHVVADDATVRVEHAAIDRLLDRFGEIGLAREQIAARVGRSRVHGARLTRVRADLSESLRLIGPPRPWGAPAAALRRIDQAVTSLGSLADELDRAHVEVRSHDVVLKDRLGDARHELTTMRETPLRSLFARLAGAIEAEARRTDREVIVRTEGEGETIDRRLAEQLSESLLQIARNAVAHGIEPPAQRASAGKSTTATVTLAARKRIHRLVIGISDDGAGVDLAAVRRRAIDEGLVAATLAEAADDDTLLALLMLPGFSTRESSDLLAGRGIGLDIALGSIQRLGGALRLSSRLGEGFTARVEVPIESGLASVLWVEAGGSEYAVFALNAISVRSTHQDEDLRVRVPHLASCLEPVRSTPAPYALELRDDGDDAELPPVQVGVDAVGLREEVLVRPLTPVVAALGPYAGAVLREDGSLRLALDTYALLPRARALGRVPTPRAART